MTTKLGPHYSFNGGGYVYEAQTCISLLKPLPHPSVVSHNNGSLLAADYLNPGSYSSGTLLTPISLSGIPDKPGKRRPKSSVRNSKSSYISRGIVYESFSRRVMGSHPSSLVCLMNFKRTLSLLDLEEGATHQADPLIKIFFTKDWPLCHALNETTKSRQQLDVVVGMSSGDVIWLELTSARYERLNKAGNVTHAPITSIQWFPESANLVVAAHADGIVVIYNVDAEDGPADIRWNSPDSPKDSTQHTFKSLHSSSKTSLAAAYKLSNHSLTCLRFVPGKNSIIVTSSDGYTRIFDLNTEKITDVIPTFLGVETVAFSGDSKYMAIGGEDDMVSVYELQNLLPVVRFQGHKARPVKVIFDHYCDDTDAYRIVSVGDDGQLIIFDFVPNTMAELDWVKPLDVHGLRVQRARPMNETPLGFPAMHITPILSEFGDAPLSDVFCTKTHLFASTADGRVWIWKKNN